MLFAARKASASELPSPPPARGHVMLSPLLPPPLVMLAWLPAPSRLSAPPRPLLLLPTPPEGWCRRLLWTCAGTTATTGGGDGVGNGGGGVAKSAWCGWFSDSIASFLDSAICPSGGTLQAVINLTLLTWNGPTKLGRRTRSACARACSCVRACVLKGGKRGCRGSHYSPPTIFSGRDLEDGLCFLEGGCNLAVRVGSYHVRSPAYAAGPPFEHGFGGVRRRFQRRHGS